ncbi:MAG: TlpA family protein disulfide reductase [Spirochaetes bacterium]|nr:TlpA family protein disulfide reductase [Spirochaetota bacterium]
MYRTSACLIFLAILPIITVSGIAAPSEADRILAEEMAALDFDPAGLLLDEDNGDSKTYTIRHGNKSATARVLTNGQKVIYPAGGGTIWIQPGGDRKIVLPGNRQVSYSAGKKSFTWTRVNDPAPDFNLPVADSPGRKISLSRLKGKVVLLDFWASWCAPCIQAMRETQKLHEKYARDGLVVLGVNIDSGGYADIQFMKNAGATFPSLTGTIDKGPRKGCKEMNDFGITGIPAVVIIDKNGIVRVQEQVVREKEGEFLGDLLIEDADRSGYPVRIVGTWRETGMEYSKDTLTFHADGRLEMTHAMGTSMYRWELKGDNLAVREIPGSKEQGIHMKVAGSLKILNLNDGALIYRQRMPMFGREMSLRRSWTRHAGAGR